MSRVLHFILSHSIFIALCAAALSFQTIQLLSLSMNSYLLAFIFFATLCGYNAYWIVSRFSFNQHYSASTFFKKSKSSFIVMFLALTGMIFCITELHLVMYNTVITFILLGLYAIPVLPFKQLHFTRKAGFVKTILLAFAWTMVTILIPLQIPIHKMDQPALLLFINRFLFMLMLCVIFDKRDAAVDKIRGLQSIATDVKPLQLHLLIGFIFISYAFISYSMLSYSVAIPQVAALILAGALALVIYFYSLQKRGYVFYYFVVDGLMFLSALLTWLSGILEKNA